jgi:hypothetical protein
VSTPPDTRSFRPPVTLLERLAEAVLLLVNLALVWIIVVAVQPHWLRLGSGQTEVLLVLGLLSGALLLVTAVALRQTQA